MQQKPDPRTSHSAKSISETGPAPQLSWEGAIFISSPPLSFAASFAFPLPLHRSKEQGRAGQGKAPSRQQDSLKPASAAPKDLLHNWSALTAARGLGASRFTATRKWQLPLEPHNQAGPGLLPGSPWQ